MGFSAAGLGGVYGAYQNAQARQQDIDLNSLKLQQYRQQLSQYNQDQQDMGGAQGAFLSYLSNGGVPSVPQSAPQSSPQGGVPAVPGAAQNGAPMPPAPGQASMPNAPPQPSHGAQSMQPPPPPIPGSGDLSGMSPQQQHKMQIQIGRPVIDGAAYAERAKRLQMAQQQYPTANDPAQKAMLAKEIQQLGGVVPYQSMDAAKAKPVMDANAAVKEVESPPLTQDQKATIPAPPKRNMSMQDLAQYVQAQPNLNMKQRMQVMEMAHPYLSEQAKMEFDEKRLVMDENLKKQMADLKELHEWVQANSAASRSDAKKTELTEKIRHDEALEGIGKTNADTKAKTGSAYVMTAQNKAEAVKAKAKAESGAKLNDDDLMAMARQAWAGDRSVFQNLGRGAQGSENIIALRRAIRKQGESEGRTPEELAMVNAEYEGTKAGERTLGTRTANVGMAVNEAKQLSTLAIKASDDWSRLGLKSLNEVEKYAESHTENQSLRKFVAANNSFVNAYSRAISPSGTPTVSDKEHAREMLDVAFSKGDYQATIEQLQSEMDAAKKSPGMAKQELRDLATNGKATSKEIAPVFSSTAELKSAIASGKVKKGDTFNDPNGTPHVVN